MQSNVLLSPEYFSSVPLVAGGVERRSMRGDARDAPPPFVSCARCRIASSLNPRFTGRRTARGPAGAGEEEPAQREMPWPPALQSNLDQVIRYLLGTEKRARIARQYSWSHLQTQATEGKSLAAPLIGAGATGDHGGPASEKNETQANEGNSLAAALIGAGAAAGHVAPASEKNETQTKEGSSLTAPLIGAVAAGCRGAPASENNWASHAVAMSIHELELDHLKMMERQCPLDLTQRSKRSMSPAMKGSCAAMADTNKEIFEFLSRSFTTKVTDEQRRAAIKLFRDSHSSIPVYVCYIMRTTVFVKDFCNSYLKFGEMKHRYVKAMAHNTGNSGVINLVVHDFSPNRVMLSAGWPHFARTNDIEIGNLCAFQFLDDLSTMIVQKL
ncbi:hypothetical protein ACP70R_039481 [Stipagrostis hirtigluma subsp. patula]